MKLIIQGKTKDVYQLDEEQYLLKFKDDVTGSAGTFDPGANQVGLTLAGAGKSALRLTKYFFELLHKEGIPTHYIMADPEQLTMEVHKATPFGQGLEVICRYRAVGSFYRRYGKYVEEGAALDSFVEITIKDDERKDPPITKDALVMLGILTAEEYEILVGLTKTISELLKAELAKKDLELYDLKLEFGRIGQDQTIALIDEISGGNMRVYKNGVYIDPFVLEQLILD